MSLPKRDGVHDRYYLIHKPDTSPELLAEADLCIQDVLNGTARENHSAWLTGHVKKWAQKRLSTVTLCSTTGNELLEVWYYGDLLTVKGERIPISGDLGSKVKQLMEYAGWYEGRSVDISIVEKYYADHGVPMMKTTQRFYRKYFGLCCEWYLAQKKLKWAADFEFALFPYLVNGIKNHLEDAYFRDMSGCELAEIEQAAGQKCQPIGHIGYYYPAEVWISEYGKLYAKYEYQDEIECFSDVFALIERELRQCNFDSAAMKTVEALDGKL